MLRFLFGWCVSIFVSVRCSCFFFFLKVLDANATMVSMVVEALASLAEACGKGCGEAFLRRALFPLLEKVRLRLCLFCDSFILIVVRDLFPSFSFPSFSFPIVFMVVRVFDVAYSCF